MDDPSHLLMPSRKLLGDAGVLVLIAGLLVAVQVLVPPSVQAQLAFDHRTFEPWSLWTSAFVHNGMNHLLQNVVGLFTTAGVTYILCRFVSEREWFWWTTATFLVLLPVLVSLTSYVVLGTVAPQSAPTERGFSGVLAGFVGFILAVLVIWTRQETSRIIAHYVGYIIWLILALEFAIIYLDLRTDVLILVASGISLCMWGLTREVEMTSVRERRHDWLPKIAFGILVTLLLALFMISLFPSNFVQNGITVNIFAHGAGLMWGMVVALGIRRFRSRVQNQTKSA